MERLMICLNTVQYRGSLACFGRLTTMRMLLDKFSPPQGRTNQCTNSEGKEDTNMCYDPFKNDVTETGAQEQEQTNVPTTEPVTEEEPVAA